MSRWVARMTFRAQLTLVVDARLRPAAGGRQPGDLRRLPTPTSRRDLDLKGAHGRRHRTGLIDRRRRRSTCTSCRRRRSPTASTPTSSCRFSTPTGAAAGVAVAARRCRRSSDPTWCAPPSTDARRWSRSSSAAVPAAPRCSAREMGGERYAVLVGIFRDQIDAHLAQLAWLLGSCGWPVSARRPRSATGWRPGRSRRSSASPAAPRGSRRASSPPGSIRRRARTKSAR